MQNPLWLSEPFTKAQAWIDLILIANYKDGFIMVRGIQVDLKVGQVGWSEPKLAEKWRWSRSKVRGFLKLLEKEQQIIIEKNNVTQVLTIVNYSEYQQESTADRTAERQQIVQQKDPNKEVNKKKEIKNINIAFDSFWNLYDKRTGSKEKIEKKWNALKPQEREEIMSILPKYKRSQPDKQFRKNPETYLNNRSWEDEIIVTGSTTKVNGSSSFDNVPQSVSAKPWKP